MDVQTFINTFAEKEEDKAKTYLEFWKLLQKPVIAEFINTDTYATLTSQIVSAYNCSEYSARVVKEHSPDPLAGFIDPVEVEVDFVIGKKRVASKEISSENTKKSKKKV